MRTSIAVEWKYHCELSKAEADYIQSMCQNYMGDGTEPHHDRRIREEIFQTLRNARPTPEITSAKGN